MANRANYLLDILVWSKTKDALKKQPLNYPEPFVPPFMQTTRQKQNPDHVAMPLDELKAYLTKPRV